ncbi:MAG: hypothetical protein HC905_26025 [Bacteroidales bacterium]|nr:hypothetical protein [Bacteroidales bacterium]
MVNKGILDIKDTLVHQVEVIAADAYGNQSSLSFRIKYQEYDNPPELNADSCFRYFSFLKENSFSTDSFRLTIPLNALYKDLCLKFTQKPQRTGYSSKIYQVGDSYVPVQYPFEISIKPNLPPTLLEKALIVRLDNNNPNSIGGTIENGFIKGRTYIMGNFTVTIDTTPPRILPFGSFSTYYQRIKKTYIAFKITDNLAGIRDYNGYIDGKWALFEFDAKKTL